MTIYSSANVRMLLLLFLAALVPAMPALAQDSHVIWQIGERDQSGNEFALAPSGFSSFREPGLYRVGVSQASEWPYCHPGPRDSWAGGTKHSYSVLFPLAQAPTKEAVLTLFLTDAHMHSPPHVRIEVNGHSQLLRTSHGGGDASIRGDLSQAKHQTLRATILADQLQEGENLLTITTLSGSWLLYDAIRLQSEEVITLGKHKDTTFIAGLRSTPTLIERKGALFQEITLELLHIGAAQELTFKLGDLASETRSVQEGRHECSFAIAQVDQDTSIDISVHAGDKELSRRAHTIPKVRPWTFHLLHHTHLDIGYTHVQDEVMRVQWEHLEKAYELAEKTKDYPEGSTFKWLPEGFWALEGYWEQASEAEKAEFLNAVRDGSIGLDALYGNELTALCRPEELLELTGYARRFARAHGLTIDTAMITDVPGYTWGIVPVLAQSGVKYFSIGPNRTHRIGATLTQWGDKPFYWRSPSGQERVLCWVAGEGYSLFHGGRPLRHEEQFFKIVDLLEAKDYPYDISYVRYNIGGDNGPPDDMLCDFVRDWNAKYAYPKLIISTPREAFVDFETSYGDQLPELSGDFTPYWEDGAASSARETAVNRAAAERLVQANALWCMQDTADYPATEFQSAWRDILLYDEHTWGAWNSISDPESDFALQQWAIKKEFALEGARKTQELLEKSFTEMVSTGVTAAVQVLNTSSWPRTQLVTVPKAWQPAGYRVRDAHGNAVPSQELHNGDLAFLAQDVPAFGACTYTIQSGAPTPSGNAKASKNSLSNGLLTLSLDPKTGAIDSLKTGNIVADLVDTSSETGLNAFIYVEGRDPKERKEVQQSKTTILDTGPLVATLHIESEAPGCRSLTREVRVVDGLPYAEIITTMDREKVYQQEAVHLAFPFQVPGARIRMDVPWAVVEAEKDQLEGSCKNYYTVQRWVDVSNEHYGVTLATVDAPLIEIGAITNDPRAIGWRESVEPTSLLYSYVMNNYWETNYKAEQEGVTTFRYAILPHDSAFDETAAARFGTEQSQPLILKPCASDTPDIASQLRVDGDGILVTHYKPSDDGQAKIVRLFNASAETASASIATPESPDSTLYQSDVDELRGESMDGTITLAAHAFTTLRIEE